MEGKRVTVAWKDTRESRRALRDALPLLRKAEQIVVTEICERELEVADSQRRLRDVAQYLSRQGVSCVADRVRPAEGTTAETLSRFVHDELSDLIVAGAYGHSRVGEWVFGGMTQELSRPQPRLLPAFPLAKCRGIRSVRRRPLCMRYLVLRDSRPPCTKVNSTRRSSTGQSWRCTTLTFEHACVELVGHRVAGYCFVAAASFPSRAILN